jgi:hypothetical protein
MMLLIIEVLAATKRFTALRQRTENRGTLWGR